MAGSDNHTKSSVVEFAKMKEKYDKELDTCRDETAQYREENVRLKREVTSLQESKVKNMVSDSGATGDSPSRPCQTSQHVVSTPPAASRSALSAVERKKILNQSQFQMSNASDNPVHISGSPTPTKMVGYSRCIHYSPYNDRAEGTYEVPIRGKYRFIVSERGEKNTDVEWFVCVGDGRRQKVAGRMKKETQRNWYNYDAVEWECEEGERVWLEGVAMKQAGVTITGFGLAGMLISWSFGNIVWHAQS